MASVEAVQSGADISALATQQDIDPEMLTAMASLLDTGHLAMIVGVVLLFLVGGFLAAVAILLAHKRLKQAKLASITRLLFLAISLSALAWVFISYAIAIYATVHLQQVYTMAELSDPAIRLILCTLFGKILENLFEHNDGALFGHTNGKDGSHD